MYVNPPIERLIGNLAYAETTLVELVSPNHWPADIYDTLTLRLRGTHTKGNGDGIAIDDDPFALLRRVHCYAGQGDFVSITGPDLRVLNIIMKPDRNGRDVVHTPSVASAPGATAFSAVLGLPFQMPDMMDPRRGFWRSGRYGSSKFGITFGAPTDLASGETGTNTITSCSVDVVAETWGGEPAFEAPPDRTKIILHKRTDQLYPTAGAVLTENRLLIPSDRSKLRGVLLKSYIPSPERAVNLFGDNDPIKLLYNKEDVKIASTYRRIREANERQFGRALPPEYLWLDLAPDGDWNRLRDIEEGVYEVMVTTTNAVANSLIRALFVRYAPGL